MQMTTELRKKITECLTECLAENPGIGREALTEKTLAGLSLGARTLKDTSPAGRANLYRSYIGTVLTELTVEGKVRRVGKGYFLTGEGLVIVRAAECRAPILLLLSARPMRKSEIFEALAKHFGTDRTKTEKDDGILLGLYDFLGLPSDVIYLLVCHCVQRTERRYGQHRRPTLRQIEKEGYRWERLGLMTQELAGEYLKEYARKQQLVPAMMTALHLGDRAPVSKELEFLERWIDWGFPPESVELAYEKTVFKCGKLEWKYCNGILRDWDKKGLHTPEEISAGDKLSRRESGYAGAAQKREQAAAADTVQDSVAWMKEYLSKTEGR